jgi:membrane protease YdiL (CAAX protease family)
MKKWLSIILWCIQLGIIHIIATALAYLLASHFFEQDSWQWILTKVGITFGLIVLLFHSLLAPKWGWDLPTRRSFYRFSPSKFIRYIGLGIILLIAYFLFSVALSTDRQISLNPDLTLLTASLIVAKGLMVGLMGSFTEELAYRGYLLRQLLDKTGSLSTALVASSFVFGLGHLVVGESLAHSLLYVVYTFFMGIVYGLVTYRAGSFWYSVALHYTWNSFFQSGFLSGSCEVDPSNNYIIRTFQECKSRLIFSFGGDEINLTAFTFTLILALALIHIYRRPLFTSKSHF